MRAYALIGFLLLSANVMAQTTYTWKDPATGRTVISDMPPPSGNVQYKESSKGSHPQGAGSLSYATRQAIEKFPVVLYTQDPCQSACTQSKDFLKARKIPYEEKILKTQEELDAAKVVFGDQLTIPSITIGRERITGFNSETWNQALDLAGYPKNLEKKN